MAVIRIFSGRGPEENPGERPTYTKRKIF